MPATSLESSSLRWRAAAAYGDWLPTLFTPEWIVTQTHEYLKTHPERSVKARRHWLHELNVNFFGHQYLRHGEGFPSAFGMETQRRGTPHQHGVVGGRLLKGVRFDPWRRRLAEISGGFCWIEIPVSPAAVCRYCSKYIAKDGEVDIWLPGKMLHPDRSQLEITGV